MTALLEDGADGAAAHLIEVAEKKLNEAITMRNLARSEIRKWRDEIDRRKAQLRDAHRRIGP
ncbi:MAG: hypothetical protein ACRENC_11880 [Gemmatimonadaceae bacterium]